MKQLAESRPSSECEQHLVIGTLDDLPCAERVLADLQRAGFVARDVTLVACDTGRGGAVVEVPERLLQFGEPSALPCQGLGTLLIVGEALAPIRPLGCRVCLHDLGQALIDTGLPDADALIYELGLLRGQCLVMVVARTPDRIHVAYRLLLRNRSAEVHIYRH